MRSRIVAVTKKEAREILRDPITLGIAIVLPLVMMFLFAYAITLDVKAIPLAVLDFDHSPESREYLAGFLQSGYFRLRAVARDLREIERLLDRGRVRMALIIPPDFSRRLRQGLPAEVQTLVDGSNSNTALIALGYAQRIVQGYSHEIEIARIRKTRGDPGPLPRIQNQRRAWYNPDLKSVPFVVVSMLVLGVMMIATIHPAAAIAMEKEAGTIEQLLVMPFRPWELMVAKVVPTFVVSLASLAIALWVPWWFQVPIRGSLFLFFALSALFLFSSLGWGLFLGTLAENLQQALLLAFFSIFPILVISGTMVPVESMPKAIQLLSYLSPLTYYMEIGLGIFLKGVGIEVLWPQALVMGVLGIIIFALGLLRFRKRLG